MWTSSRANDDEALDAELEQCERAIADLTEACEPILPWDGVCGLVLVQDEDIVRCPMPSFLHKSSNGSNVKEEKPRSMDIESPTQSKKEANKKHGIHRFKNIFKRALKPVSPEKQFALKSRSSGIVDSEGESASEVLRNLKTRSIYVKIISGNGLRAADSNNLSDPYVVLKLGDHSASTRVQPKTLNPSFEETFVFNTDDVTSALDSGKPWIEFKVYDKDLLSSDDFLGNATVLLNELDSKSIAKPILNLPLGGIAGGGRPEVHGELSVAIWFGALNTDDSSSSDPAGATTLTLMPQPGFTGAPQVIQSRQSCLYEEPIFVCLGFTVDGISGLSEGENSPTAGSLLRSPKKGGGGKSKNGEPHQSSWASGTEEDLSDDGNPWGEDSSGMDLLPFLYDQDGSTADCPSPGSNKNNLLLYCRIALGSQSSITRVVRVRNGNAAWTEALVFISPLPMKDRNVRVEVWQTSSTRSRGRAAYVAQVPLFSMLPDLSGLDPDLRQKRQVSVPLIKVAGQNTAASGQDAPASLLLSSMVADLDTRRAVYSQAFLESSQDNFSEVQKWSADSSIVSRLQSSTRELTPKEMKRLAKLTASELNSKEVRHRRREDAAAAVTEAASYGATKVVNFGTSWIQYTSAMMESFGLSFAGKGAEDENTTTGSEGELSSSTSPPPPPVPLACLRLSLEGIKIPLDDSIKSSVYCVLKCGSSWGRTPMVRVSGEEISFGIWHAEIPIFDPATVLTLAVFRKLGLHITKGYLASHPLMVGKLRVRLSTLEPDRNITVELPLLSDRKKGASRVGSAHLSMRVSFVSLGARLAALVAPPLPKEAYVHGIEDKAMAMAVRKARRRMVSQWLNGCNPGIPPSATLAIENTEREEFMTSRLKANARRIRLSFTVLRRGSLFYRHLASWENPVLSITACAVAVATTYYPSIAFGVWMLLGAHACYRSIPENLGMPPGMEHDPPETDSEDEEQEHGHRLDISTSNPYTILKRKYQKLQRITLMVQNVLDDVATSMERMIAIATWQDPLSTLLLVVLLVILGVAFLMVGSRPMVAGLQLFMLRPPQMRTPWTPPPVALFSRLPSRADRIM